MTTEHLRQTLQRYHKDLKKRGYEEKRNDVAETVDEMMNHLCWMASYAQNFLNDQDQDKAHRWLGFIQGVCWAKGVFTIKEMREHNTAQ